MPLTRCAGVLSELSKGKLKPELADRLVKEIKRRVDRGRMSGDVTGLVERITKEMGEELKVEAAIRRRNEILTQTKYQEAKQKLAASKSKYTGLRDILVGQGQSIGARQKMWSARFKGRMIQELEREGLLSVFNDDDYARPIARELAARNTPDPYGVGFSGLTGTPGDTRNPKAAKVAEIIYRWQSQSVEFQNDAGAWIRRLPGYITRTSHDAERIKGAGKAADFEKWKTFIVSKLDTEETFKHVPLGKEDDFLRNVWEALSSGLHFKHADGNFDVDSAMSGSANIAKKLSRERLLHFKGPDEWMDYNAEFGARNFREAIMSGFDYAGQSIGLMETLGPNPQAVIQRLMKEAQKELRKSSIEGNKQAAKDLAGFDNPGGAWNPNLADYYAQLDGTTYQPGSVRMARIGAGIRNVQSMAKLGGSTISSLPDVVTLASELKYQGIDLLGSYNGTMEALFKGRKGIEREEMGELVLSGLEGMLGELNTRYNPDDGLKGTMSRMMYLNFRFNGQNWWNDVLKSYATSAMSTNLAQHANRSYDQLPSALTNVLKKYEIGPREWSVVKELVRKSPTGINRVFPEQAYNVQHPRLRELFKDNDISDAKLRTFKKELQSKLDTYFTDRSDVALPTPGPAQRAWMLGSSRPGTPIGEALRFIGQFKSFPLTYLSKVYGREAEGMNSGGRYAIAGLAHLIIGTTVMGYMAMTIKDLVKGRTPRPANDPKTWMAAMAQGGGAGIYGDFLFGEFNRYGRTWTSTIAGPTLGQIDDVGELFNNLRSMKFDEAGDTAFRMVKSNTPFINLFYTRSALDYLLLYQVQEMMNPGFLDRMERRMRDENGQEFLLPPSEKSSILGFKP